MPDITITADKVVSLSIDPASIKDREGNPAAVQGTPVWASSDETVVTLQVAEGGMSAVAVSHLAGAARVLVEADADLGDGVKPINGSLEIEVTPGVAAAITITAGEPTPKS
jgi:hypothetical protein